MRAQAKLIMLMLGLFAGSFLMAADMVSPPNSLVVDDTGKVGVGTATPSNPLHVVRDDGTAQLKISENITGANVRTLLNLDCVECTPAFRFKQASRIWFFRMLQSGDFSMDYQGQPGTDFVFKRGGNMTILGSLSQQSSQESKERIQSVDLKEVLEKVVSLPVSEWSYKHDKGRVKHIGPMAEDFHALFKVGVDNKSISSIDTSGVALAAIKSLHQVNKRLKADTHKALAKKDQQIADLQRQNSVLSKRMQAMESKLTEIDALKQQLASVMSVTGSAQLVQALTD